MILHKNIRKQINMQQEIQTKNELNTQVKQRSLAESKLTAQVTVS